MSTCFPSRTIAAVAALLFLSVPARVDAAFTSSVTGSTVTMTGDLAGDTLTITQSGGLFRHNRFTAGDPGYNSDFDFNSGVAGDQTVSITTGVININAGDGNDTIGLGAGINLRGMIDGGPGSDTLDYSGYTTAVGANLGLGTTGLNATLGADQENPPTGHAATGSATVTNYNIATHTFDITVTVTNLAPADVTGFHIHQAAVGVNGPIIVDFVPLGGLTPVSTGFTFSANDLNLPGLSEAAFLGGGTYVNIHTAVFPAGAIRGQLFPGGNVSLSTGAATGTTSVANIENVTGGTGGDSLVGSSAVNTINGGAGADWIVGGPGNDVLRGDAGADVIVWSNGDGSDVDEGGADGDTVQVNGSTAAADIFSVSANGTRLRFDRSNLGLFSLDIGTVETLVVNGIGGSDDSTVNDLTGVASLAALNLNGFDSDDIFTVVPVSAGAVAFNVHGGPGSDTLQGPNAASTWNVTAPNQGGIAGLVAGFRFIEALVGGAASDTFNVKAFATGTPAVTGGAGADALIYNAESRAVSGDTTPPDGLIVSPGVQSVAFTQIETLNIVNPQPAIALSDLTVAEGSGPTSAVFNVTLSNASLLTVTVNFATANGTATAPGDYTSQTGTLTFAPGDLAKTILVPIASDGIPEPRESFFVNLSGAVNAVIADAQGVATITDARVVRAPRNDYDGDGRTDLTVYRPATGTWFILKSSANYTTWDIYQWGVAADVPAAGDYDGDGRTDLTVYRPATGTWFILKSSTNYTTWDVYQWGVAGDVPVPGDYDGDGRTDVTVYRPATGTWFILKSSTNYTAWDAYQWGIAGDVPVPGDYDADDRTDVTMYRPSSGTWFILQSSTNYTSWNVYSWGVAGDVPVAGDYDADDRTDVTVYRPSSGTWFVLKSGTNYTMWDGYQWGVVGDVPMPGDYDGDGRTDVTVYRPSTGTWFILKSSTNFTAPNIYQWGMPGDTPVFAVR